MNIEKVIKAITDTSDIIIKGGFDAYENNTLFAEESFQILKGKKSGLITYLSEILCRIGDGQFLKIKVIYQVNKEWVPTSVVIEKLIGSDSILETFVTDVRKNCLNYTFKNTVETKTCTLQVPPKFEVSTPCYTTSGLFVISKKYDPTGRNFFNILTSENILQHTSNPKMKYLVLTRQGTASKVIEIKGRKLKAEQFSALSYESVEKANEVPLEIYLSRYYGIPYLITHENIRVEIRFLNELESAKLDEFS